MIAPEPGNRLHPIILAAVLFVVAAGGATGYYVTSSSTDTLALVFAGFFVFAFSFLNRIWALYFLVFAMMFSPEFQVATIQGTRAVTLRAEDFLILIIMAGWLANLAVDRSRTLFRSHPVNVPIIAYTLVILLATLIGFVEGRVEFYQGFFYAIKYIEYFVLFFFVLNTNLSTGQLKALVYTHIVTSIVLGIYGMSQIGTVSRVTTPFEGSSNEPATMGGYLVLSLSIALAYAVHSFGPARRLFFLGMTALLLPPLLYTLSRGSYVALVFAYVALFFLSYRKPMVMLGMLAVSAVAVPLMPDAVIERVLYTFEGDERGGLKVGNVIIDESAALRIRGYARAIERFGNAPIFGYGVRGAGFIDGEYIRVVAETGLAGLLCFGVIQIVILRYVFKLTHTLKSDFSRPLAVGFLAGHVGLLVHATGASTFIIIRIMEPFWFLFALLCHFETRDAEMATSESPARPAAAFDRRAWIARHFPAPGPAAAPRPATEG